MKKFIRKSLQSFAIVMLIFCCVVTPVSASDLAAADYQVGMDALASVTEEEWLSSGSTAISSLRYEGSFVEAGNSQQAEGVLDVSSVSQVENYSTSSALGVERVGTSYDTATDMQINVDEAYPLSSGDIQVLTAPTAGIEGYIRNPESLRDGMITTETEIIWLFTGDAATYYYGGFQQGYITERGSNGFVTLFYTPGTYYVLCYGENDEGETSEVTGFVIDVVAEFENQTIEDTLESAEDSKTYSIDIDFTNMDTAAVCLVRTGKTEVQMTIVDESGNVIRPYATSYSIPKRWVYIDKPSEDAEICTYTLTVAASAFNEESGAFRVIIGNKNDTEAMMGGLENAIDLELFVDSKNNYIYSTYVPRSDEYWFITSMPYPTVITLLSNNSDLRFKIKDMDTLVDLFDSNDSNWDQMHSTRFTGTTYSNAEKVTFQALTGTRRYLVIYSNKPSQGAGLSEREFRLGVGQPMYGLTNQNVYGSSVTVRPTTYSSTTLNTETSSFPNTGVMNQAYLSGVSLSQLDRWRLLAPNATSYKTSSTGSTYITYNFTAGSSFNTPVRGTWDLGITLKSGNSATTCYPTVNFSFYYQYGDNTITIVPAN